jgi:hypothetical protein
MEAPGTDVTVSGFEFFDTNNIVCKWVWTVGSTVSVTNGVFLSSGSVLCRVPDVSGLTFVNGTAQADILVSLAGDDPATYTTPGATRVTVYRCGTTGCGDHGACRLRSTGSGVRSECDCDDGFGGPSCATQCPGSVGGLVCSGHGECVATTGACACGDGWGGPDCSVVTVQCPTGRFTLPGGAACNGTCPGSTGCVTNGGCDSTCSGHGACLESGDCFCNATAGFFGVDCSQQCPVGPNGLACSGSGQCRSDGSCACESGSAGHNCSIQCPRGGASNALCSGAGSCNAQDGSCHCNRGFSGADCGTQCPGTAGCSVVNGQNSCTVECSGNGVCSNGVCGCGASFWGPTCQNQCSCGHGVCDGATGACRCLSGWVGPSCALECPVPATNGQPCSGNGKCVFNATSGQALCECSAGWVGASCEVKTCIGNCFQHGTCQNGVCQCATGWLPPYCAVPVPQNGGGVIQWRTAPAAMPRDEGSVELDLVRDGSVTGNVTCQWACIAGSAVEGRDYACGGGGTVSWGDGDSDSKTITLETLVPPLVNGQEPTSEVSFDVSILRVSPAGAVIGSRRNVTVLLYPKSLQQLLDENVHVTFRLSVSYSQVTRKGDDPEAARFREQLLQDLCAPTVLNTPQSRVIVSSVVSSSGGGAVLVTLVLLPPASSGPQISASQMAHTLVSMIGDPGSQLYSAQRTWSRFTDISFHPVVVEALQPASSPSPSPSASPGGIAAAVVIPLVVLGACGFIAFRRRRSIAEWVLWRAGQMRFNTLSNTDHRRELEIELEEMEREQEHDTGGYDQQELVDGEYSKDDQGDDDHHDEVPLHGPTTTVT